MSYSRPAGNAADASWSGALAYSRPAGNAADATWVSATVSGVASAPSPLGAAQFVGVATPAVVGAAAAPGPLAGASLRGSIVDLGVVATPGPLFSAASIGASVHVGGVTSPSPLGVPVVVGTVIRYELRGEVRDQGVLVNRRVRAYRRDTGALMAEADTVVGAFSIPVGFTAGEYYLVPINLDAAATDFAPPCANRVTSVLAMDPA